MSCGCNTSEKDGKSIVDHVRNKGKHLEPTKVPHEIECECGKTFTMSKVVEQCPHCNMTYGVTPCSSDDITKIKPAGINY